MSDPSKWEPSGQLQPVDDIRPFCHRKSFKTTEPSMCTFGPLQSVATIYICALSMMKHGPDACCLVAGVDVNTEEKKKLIHVIINSATRIINMCLLNLLRANQFVCCSAVHCSHKGLQPAAAQNTLILLTHQDQMC